MRKATSALSSALRPRTLSQRGFHLSAEQNAEQLAIDDDEAPTRLVKSFEIERIDRNIYRSNQLLRGLKGRDAVYGGQVIGQSLRAAQDTVEEEKAPHSMHCYFLKTGEFSVRGAPEGAKFTSRWEVHAWGSVNKPIVYLVDRVREGRTFCTRIVKAVQDGENLFTASLSFQKKETGGMRHQRCMPAVPPPDKLLSYRQLIMKALENESLRSRMTPHQQFMLEFKLETTPPTFHRVYEHRPVDQDIFDFSHDKKLTTHRMWIRSVVPHGHNPALQRQLAAYISDSSIIETALYPHISRGFIPSMVFSLDHAVWFHKADFTLDDWCLWEVQADVAGECRTFGSSRLYTAGGQLVLTAVQEGLVRPLDKGKESILEVEQEERRCAGKDAWGSTQG